MVKTTFKDLLATKWAVKECKHQGLTTLFQPVNPIAYESLVQEFYQNLTFDCTWLGSLSSSVAGIDIELTSTDIATTLQCSYECLSDILT